MKRTITFSSATTYCQCERKYAWRYELGLRPKAEEEGEALRDGIQGHDVLAVYMAEGLSRAIEHVNEWRARQLGIGEDAAHDLDQRAAKMRAVVRAVSIAYPLAAACPRVEHVLSAPVALPTGNPRRTWTFAGKVDGVADNRLIDWKFTGDPMRTINDLTLSYQTELYAIALQQEGVLLSSAEYRLIQVPKIRLCAKDGNNAAVYEDRVFKCLQEPGAIQTHEVFLNPARVDSARNWLCNVTKKIDGCRRAKCWLGNRLACYDWERRCEYYPLCEALATGSDVDWLIAEKFCEGERHPELVKS